MCTSCLPTVLGRCPNVVTRVNPSHLLEDSPRRRARPSGRNQYWVFVITSRGRGWMASYYCKGESGRRGVPCGAPAVSGGEEEGEFSADSGAGALEVLLGEFEKFGQVVSFVDALRRPR